MSNTSSATPPPATPVTTIRLPIAHLPSAVLPGATVTLTLATDALRLAITAATELNDSRLLLTGGDEDELAVVARVPNVGNLPTGESAAIVRVEGRARITSTQVESGAATFAEAELLIDGPSSASTTAATRELRATLELIAEKRNSRRLPELLRTIQEPGALADAVALWAEFSDDNRLVVLRATDVADRVDALHSWARNHLNELQVAETIRNDVSEGMDKQQREYLLRQQMASIRKELGEGDEDVTDEYRAKLADLDAPESVKIAIDKELDRFERMSSQSPEHSWIRTWLDRILEMPWGERSDDNIDLDDAQTVLDADHYGLDDVKDRIVEFLATRKLRHERGLDARVDADGERTARGHGSVITLIGPPGVGKTSLGESIARAMGREFVRVALGGVRDESEIRGHRRTYVGSQPGRIVRALQEAKTMNPVILLDEVDKLAAGGWSGDPTAALLEVLDPAQNHTFRDHYLEVDLDLSEVVFIATANVADTIPGPLLDRMDLVRLDGYTEAEKTFIAHRYLLPRQIERAGLEPDEVTVDDAVISSIISGWTREAGVRSLERELGRLVRKVTAKVATGSDTPIAIGADELTDWIGRRKVDDEVIDRTDTPGVATGLAVTGAGGDVLFVETTAFPTGPDSEPGLTLTGQLGDVMKESA
ncbi:MAG: AAA family ATPase, partial [Ilumatobacter sp.]|nr:AAA family ATPase [Ilumatobacter sp.]